MKHPGFLVKNKANGKRGRTYHGKGKINDKVPVYYETDNFKFSDKATLVAPENLIVIGHID